MHAINNKVVINRVSKRMIRTDRIRNIFSIIAIILTTFMISVIFSIGVSFIHNYNVYKIRDNGSLAKIFLSNPTEDQYKAISNLDYIKNAGLRIYAGSVSVITDDKQKANISMEYYDKTEWKKHYTPAISDIVGTYPVKVDEIMLSSKAMKYLGIEDAKIGSKIILTHSIKGVESTKEYTLSGIFRNYSIRDEGGIPIILVSEEFCLTHNLGIEDNGTIAISVPKGKEEVLYDKLLREIPHMENQFNAFFDMTSSQSETWGGIAIIIMLALFIVLSGYLLIYNIMYISISKDIRFYGMLKTIGTTPRQIKKIVRNQLYLLAVVGIPIGLFIGAMVSFGMVPAAMKVMGGTTKDSIMPSDISFHPIIFIGTTLFTLLTIAISLRKPARVAGNVSPVEALRYMEIKEKRKKKEKRRTNGGKVFRMALSNVLRDKKKAVLVFASLFMGSITLLSINSFLKSINVENYLNSYVPHNFEYSSLPPHSLDKFDNQFIDTIKAMDGIETVETMHSAYGIVEFDEEVLEGVLKREYNKHFSKQYSYENFLQLMYELSSNKGIYSNMDISYGTWLLAVDDNYVEEYNKISADKINLKDFHEGKLVLMAGDSDEYLQSMTGKTLTIMNDTSNKTFGITIGGIISKNILGEAFYFPHVVGAPPTLVVSKKFMERFTDGEFFINYIYIDCSKDKEVILLEELNKLNDTRLDKAFYFKSRLEERKSFETTIITTKIITSGISAILFMVGVLNFINVMITGVNSRRRELAVMESVGMTKEQIGRMLTFEGLFYALITSALLMTIGNLILWFISENINSVADYAEFHYSIELLSLLILIQMAVCLVVPTIIFKTSSKEIVSERLRSIVN